MPAPYGNFNIVLQANGQSWSYDGTPTGGAAAGNKVLVTFVQDLPVLTGVFDVGDQFQFTAQNGMSVSFGAGAGQTASTINAQSAVVVSSNQIVLTLANAPTWNSGTLNGVTTVTLTGNPISTQTTTNAPAQQANQNPLGTNAQGTIISGVGATGYPNASNLGASGSPYYEQITNPAALPVTVAFQLSPALQDYLKTLGYKALADMYKAVTISVPAGAGVQMWPSYQEGSATNHTASTGQTVKGQPLELSTNYYLADLAQSLPTGATSLMIPATSQSNNWGLTPGIHVDLPNLTMNNFASGVIQIGVAGQTANYDTLNNNGKSLSAFLTYDPTNLATAPTTSNGYTFTVEPHVTAQPGVNSSTGYPTDANMDLTYINFYSTALDATVVGYNNQPLPANYQGPTGLSQIYGGAGFGSLFDGSTQLYQNLAYSSRLSTGLPSNIMNGDWGGTLFSPNSAPDITSTKAPYHDFSFYIDYLAGQPSTALILSGGTKAAPTSNGSYTFSYTAHFYAETTQRAPKTMGSQDGYVILSDNVTPNHSLYIPMSSTSPQPQGVSSGFWNGFNFIDTVSGGYGANIGYFEYNNMDLATQTNIANYIQTNAPSSQQQAQTGNAQSFASADVMAGLNFGIIGSTVQFHGGDLGKLGSYQWYASDGPIYQGVWGPWAWGGASWNGAPLVGTTMGDTATNTQTINAMWNTWVFNGTGYTETDATKYANTANISTATKPLLDVGNIYFFAYQDRLTSNSAILTENNAIGAAPGGSPIPFGYGVGGSAQTGYLLVTIGAPNGYYDWKNQGGWSETFTDYNYSLKQNISDWFNRVELKTPSTASVDLLVNNVQTKGWTGSQVINAILSDPYNVNDVIPVIKIYQGALNRLPDQAGEQHHSSALASGQTLQQLSNIFADSAEFNGIYHATASTPINQTLLTEMYNNILQREPDKAAEHYYLNGGFTVGGVLNDLTYSQEFNNNNASAISLYQNQQVVGINATHQNTLFDYQAIGIIGVAYPVGWTANLSPMS